MHGFSFEAEIVYSQIALFRNGLQNPFNDWSEAHVNQRFSWREGSVSFGTLSGDGECTITVRLMKEIEMDEKVKRAIVVPFIVEKGGIEVGSVLETVSIDLPEGTYEVLFTAENVNRAEHYTFSFIKSEHPIAKVLKADDELTVPDRLVMTANPAI